MIFGEINEDTKELKLEFINIDEKEFVEKEININDILSEEELIEKINEEKYDENKYYKIIINGNKNFSINKNKILKNILYQNIIKITDKRKLEINLSEISKQNNLKGIFVKNLLDKIQTEPENKEKIEKALQIGLEAFECKM